MGQVRLRPCTGGETLPCEGEGCNGAIADDLGCSLALAVSEDDININEQHAMVVVDPAQASADGNDDVSPPRVGANLHVRRVVHLLNTPFH